MNESFRKTLDYALTRLKEPSTWAGIAVFIGMFGLSDETLARITNNGPAVITAVATLIAIFAPSGKKTVVAASGEAAPAVVYTDPAAYAVPTEIDEPDVGPSPGDSR